MWAMNNVFILAVVLAATYLLLWPLHPYPFSWALKAAPVLLLALVAQFSDLRLRDKILYALAMLTSASGDIFLDLDRTLYLKQALFSFLLTQWCYIALLWPRRTVSGFPAVLALLVPAVCAASMLYLFYPQTGALWWPVIIYVVFLWGMVALALLSGQWPVAVGGSLFFIADSLIGVNRFWLLFEHSTPVIVSLYISGQLLLGYGLLLRRNIAADTRLV